MGVPRPDLRRILTSVGPVVVFAASNFPFAFSVAGGDTASALAAGSAVILKAHSGHPQLSQATADVIIDSLAAAGAPEGLFTIIFGTEAGRLALQHPEVKAGAFTGSIGGGRALFDIAQARPEPIPFYGELGSVNPSFVTRAALEATADEIVDGFVTSVSGSAGQLCTKPGFLFVPSENALGERIAAATSTVAEHRLLNPSITAGYRERRDAILATPGVTVISQGELRVDADGNGWATPTIVSVPAAVLREHHDSLLDEAFGPLSVMVEYDDEAELAPLAAELFEGNLTGTVHAADGENTPALRELVEWMTQSTGRVLFGGWPTGVAVTPAMQHGGPWPATTNDSSTSVGTAAIGRFLRPVAYQGAPQDLLPPPLRDDNPWGVPQRRNPAGQSQSWGSRAG
jgi:NADP-dependent aldehyde dehydrogenase